MFLQWNANDTIGPIAMALFAIAPLLGWISALYITRQHVRARARLRRPAKLILSTYYALFGAAFVIDRLLPVNSWHARSNFAAVLGILNGGGIAVAFTLVYVARKIRKLDLSGSCPACGYELKGIQSSKCPECGNALDGVGGSTA